MRKCKICQGQKTVYGMGNVREKCKECNGRGFLPDAVEPAKETKKMKEKIDVK